VPDFVPFPALRYASGPGNADLTAVCAPPYDVIDPEQRAELLAVDPHNSVRLILPDSYDAAARALREWQADGTLVTERHATFSAYRMRYVDDDGRSRITTGVIGALAVDRDGVLPHERTLPKAKSDRLELLRATRANLDPIWGLSLASGLSDLVDTTGDPVAVATDRDGVRHERFRVADQGRVDAIRAAVSAAPFVLADGHHRFETACAYHDERGPADTGAAAIMALVVELAPDQLCVRAIHRLLDDLGDTRLRGALAPSFDIHAIGTNDARGVDRLLVQMHERDGLGLVDREGLALLTPRPALERAMAAQPAVLHDVDAARFDAGIRTALPGATLSYRDDAHTVAAAVEKGEAGAAVLLRPVAVDTIRAAAEAGVRMPEKTTFFAPKPRTGMVFRTLDVV
jgi:uncharacterized protein (DUF1015 family)